MIREENKEGLKDGGRRKEATFCEEKQTVIREITVDLNYHRTLLGHAGECSSCSKLLDTRENCPSIVLNALLPENFI